MGRYEVKEAMDQVHISQEMQEEIIRNLQQRMENEKKHTMRWNFRKTATAAAALVLAVGVIGFPVRALVTSVVKERMEQLPREEVREMNDMVQSKPTEADTFSREYSASEEERNKVLWKEYENGKFPENALVQVDNAEDAPEGTVCYVRSTGIFNLPEQEMTDEELLEIIDFQHKMSYAVSQSSAAQEARAQVEAEEKMWREKIQALGGISEEEAIEIGRKHMKEELGEAAAGMEVLKYQDGSVAVMKWDISEKTKYEHTSDVAYGVIFTDESSAYHCVIDVVDGKVLETY